MNKIKFFAQEASYYSAIVRPMLRYKCIPFKETKYGGKIFSRFFEKSGSVQLPQIETTDGEVIQDSTIICDYLESKYPEKSMIPQTPIQLMLAKIIQEFANDFMILPAMHYRWNFKRTNWRICYYEFAKLAVPDYLFFLRPFIAINITPRIEMAYRKMGGLDEDFLPEIEQWYLDFLEKLNNHFLHHHYLFGDKPSIADCALMGPLYAHLGRDAYPKKLMKKVAPKVSEWVLRMNQPEGTDTDFMPHDIIPETLIPVLDIIFKSQGPKTKAVIKKTDEYMNLVLDRNQLFRRMSGKIEFKLGQYVGLRPAEIHMAWLRQKTLHEYDQLSENNKKLVKEFLALHDWLEFFDIRLKQPIKRVRNKYYHYDADETIVVQRDLYINQGAFSGGKKARRESLENK